MFRNYLKIAFRNIWKNKAFSLINIIGLSIGLSAAFVIGSIIYYDLTFDKFHKDGGRIYRVTTEFTSPDGMFHNSGVSVPLAQALKNEATGVERISPLYPISMHRVKNGATGRVLKQQEHVIYTDGSYFEVFAYQWLAGNPENALANPNETVLTEERANRYFPNLSPNEIIGKTLVYNDTLPVRVTGVVENFEQRSDLIFEGFVSIGTIGDEGLKKMFGDIGWYSTNGGSQLFVKLDENTEMASVQQQLTAIAKEHVDKQMLAFGQQRNFHLQPLADLHFNPDYGTYDYTRSQASQPVLISLGFVALFLLLLGCINFINLNTAQASRRAKEIGIRKTLGSSKKQLVFQFLGETFLLTTAASGVSLFLSYWLLQFFADFIPQDISFDLLGSPIVVVSIILLVFILTFLSGWYPALFLSRFKPVLVLKNQVFPGESKAGLRRYLTVFQFTIAQIFIIATLVVGKQLHYALNKDMGFKTEAITNLMLPFRDNPISKRLAFGEALKSISQIEQVSLGWIPPASNSSRSAMVKSMNGEKETQTSLQLLTADQNYLDLYGIELLAGRNRLNDTIREYVINETGSRKLGFEHPADAIGKTIKVDEELIPIVGVMKNFNQRSLKNSIQPMALEGDWYRSDGNSQFNMAHIALKGNSYQWRETMQEIEKNYKNFYPEADFQLNFFDEDIKRFYEQERRTSILLSWAMGFAIAISCLGLLGLVIHATERRTKEIGIRKILGATLAQLNLLLCREFLILVGIAFAIAVPIAWWGMNNWLQNFAYKTELSWWVFVLSGVAMLLIALVIISIRTIAAANRNPVKSLRTE